MRVLITGGTGFIGSRLGLACVSRGWKVRILGQENTEAESENRAFLESRGAEITLASVTDTQVVANAVKGVDVVFHLAAAQHEANVPNERFWKVNVEGTQNLLEISATCGVRRFVHGSTIGVYGPGGERPLDENSPANPDNIYGITKWEGEKIVRSFQDRIPVVVIRISETYGPGDRRLLKLFKGIQSRLFVMLGSGRNFHHLIYIDDLVNGLILAATQPVAVGKTFVLAGPRPVTTYEMITTIANQLGVPSARWRVPLWPFQVAAVALEATLRPLGIQPPLHRRRMDFFRKNFCFSIDSARHHLGFEPKIQLEEGVFRTAKWYRDTGLLKGHQRTVVPVNGLLTEQPSLPDAMEDDGLTAKIEPFDSFWEGPEDVEAGYKKFYQFYKHNYLRFIPEDKNVRILVVSCGPGYFLNLLENYGYRNILGIDSDPSKVAHALKRNLPCQCVRAVPYLRQSAEHYDVIFCEQELNHLTKEEILMFLRLCHDRLCERGILVVHGLNGANPVTGAEALAQNFDHYNTFTEYTLRQILRHCGFTSITIIPLNLYVFYKNPLNYVLIALDRLYSLLFTFSFMLYGKANRIWTKKIAAVAHKGA